MLGDVKALFRDADRLYKEWHHGIENCRDSAVQSRSKEEMADTAFALKKVAEMMDALKRKAQNASEVVQKMACATSVSQGSLDPIRTPWVTATLDAQEIADVPDRKRDPETWRRLMSELGVSAELTKLGPQEGGEHRTPVVDLHYVGLQQLMAERNAQGLPRLKSIDREKIRTNWRLSPMRGTKRSILESDEGE
jgi:hypothetical protein